MVKFDTMSRNVVNIIKSLSKNQVLLKLVANDVSNPFSVTLPNVDADKMIDPTSDKARILPFPFSPEGQATTEDKSFIRVYYNNGDFDGSESVLESQLHIDVIVAKNLWLCNNGVTSLIRPYEIAALVIHMLGKGSLPTTIQLDFDGFSHLSVNTKYDCIRLYCNYVSVGRNQSSLS